jgi:hypothetical protein
MFPKWLFIEAQLKKQVDAFLREYAKKHVSSLRINSNGGEGL